MNRRGRNNQDELGYPFNHPRVLAPPPAVRKILLKRKRENEALRGRPRDHSPPAGLQILGLVIFMLILIGTLGLEDKLTTAPAAECATEATHDR